MRIPTSRKADEEIRFALGRSSLGAILVASGDHGVIAIAVGEDSAELAGNLMGDFPAAHIVPGGREERSLVRAVVRFVERPVADLDFDLDLRGTAFQRRVWREVQKVPPGQTTTYAEIARRIGAPRAMRAVGSACANAPAAFAIPCHRVLRSDGTFSAAILGSPARLEAMLAREAMIHRAPAALDS